MTTERLPATRQNALQRLSQKRGTEEVGPLELDVWHGILLDEIAGRLDELGEATILIGRLIEKMGKMMDSEKFKGKVDTIALSATDNQACLNILDRWHYSPLVTAFITNDGPNSVQIAINDPYPWMTIKNSETRTIDHTKARERINRIYYKCVAGETASFRVEGEY